MISDAKYSSAKTNGMLVGSSSSTTSAVQQAKLMSAQVSSGPPSSMNSVPMVQTAVIGAGQGSKMMSGQYQPIKSIMNSYSNGGNNSNHHYHHSSNYMMPAPLNNPQIHYLNHHHHLNHHSSHHIPHPHHHGMSMINGKLFIKMNLLANVRTLSLRLGVFRFVRVCLL